MPSNTDIDFISYVLTLLKKVVGIKYHMVKAAIKTNTIAIIKRIFLFFTAIFPCKIPIYHSYFFSLYHPFTSHRITQNKKTHLFMIWFSITDPNAILHNILKKPRFILNQILSKIFIIHIFYPISSLFDLFCQSAMMLNIHCLSQFQLLFSG